MKFIFTHHAIEQYISRINPSLTYAEAVEYLENASQTAVKMDNRTHAKDLQFRIPGEVVLITKPEKEGHVVVTIIPEGYLWEVRAQQRAVSNDHAATQVMTLTVNLDITCFRAIDQSKVELLVHEVILTNLKKAAGEVQQRNANIKASLTSVGIVRQD